MQENAIRIRAQNAIVCRIRGVNIKCASFMDSATTTYILRLHFLLYYPLYTIELKTLHSQELQLPGSLVHAGKPLKSLP